MSLAVTSDRLSEWLSCCSQVSPHRAVLGSCWLWLAQALLNGYWQPGD